MKENSFSKQLPVLLGARMGSAEAGPCLNVAACGCLAQASQTLLGEPGLQPTALSSPCPSSRQAWPLLSRTGVWEPSPRQMGHQVLEKAGPKRGASCNLTTAFVELKTAMTAGEPGKGSPDR